MRAVQFVLPGPVTALQVGHIDDPTPGGEEVLIQFAASSINPADVKIRTGQVVPRAGRPPFTLGYDLVGTVVDKGVNATSFDVGDRVLGMSALAITGCGTWSDLVCLRETSVARVPEPLETTSLARLPLAGLTAYQAVQRLAPSAGDEVVVAGAAGSVGRLVVELLLHRQDVVVTGVVRRADQVEDLRAIGDVHVHVGAAPTRSADGLIDAAGGDFSHALVNGGHYVSLVPDALPSKESLVARSIRRTVVITQESGQDLEQLVRLVASERIHLPTPKLFHLDDIHAAHEEYEKNGQRHVVITR